MISSEEKQGCLISPVYDFWVLTWPVCGSHNENLLTILQTIHLCE